VAVLGWGVVVERKAGVAVTLADSVALAVGVADGKVRIGSTGAGAAGENWYQPTKTIPNAIIATATRGD